MPDFRPSQEFRLPLSGNVTQAINPWAWTMRVFGGQFGLVNVNLGTTPNPETEQAVLDEVGTCGRQTGRLGDALAVLLRHIDRSKLEPDEGAAILALEQQLADVEQVKRRRGIAPNVQVQPRQIAVT
jgi:hypothetical protein